MIRVVKPALRFNFLKDEYMLCSLRKGGYKNA